MVSSSYDDKTKCNISKREVFSHGGASNTTCISLTKTERGKDRERKSFWTVLILL